MTLKDIKALSLGPGVAAASDRAAILGYKALCCSWLAAL